MTMSLCCALTSCSKNDNEGPVPSINENQHLRITVGSRVVTATLYNNPTARDFIAFLPITVNLTDYAGTEKIFYPSTKLSTSERNTVSDPAIGDINCYAPWGNIAIFYRNYSGSRDLIRIARISEGVDVFSGSGAVNNVTFELVE